MAKRRDGYTIAEREALERTFGDLPIVDATGPLFLDLTESDIARGIPNDIYRCAYSHCARRAYGCTQVMFLRRTAYLDFLNIVTGKRELHRFLLSTSTANNLKAVDKNGKPRPGRYRLSQPWPSKTLDAQLSYARRRAEMRRTGELPPLPPRNKRHVTYLQPVEGTEIATSVVRHVEAATTASGAKRAPSVRAVPGATGVVRDGIGLVHFVTHTSRTGRPR